MKKNLLLLIILLILITIGIGLFFYYKNKTSNNKSTKNTQTTTSTVSPAASSSPIKTPEKISSYNVPILMYHYIRDFNDPNDEIGTNLSVSPATFDKQLKWLSDNGYQSVNPDYLLTPYTLPLKPIILTFDDGYTDAYTNAFPILKKYGFTATFYIITSSVGKNEYMSWTQIQELLKSKMNIGSHSQNHPNLANSSDAQLITELKESKNIIEEKIGQTISDFCYPAGKYDERVIKILKENNYKTAVTTKNGVANQNSDLFTLPRIRTTNATNLSKALN
ncbi:MAG: polysaccharide deacetylase family protein [Patescibacteria group bacterium]|nr:polysaccharide deacetylase family protein [Patescibacteria group bacterium]